MKTTLALIFVMSTTFAFAQTGVDPLTKITDANLVCGQVNGKFIIFSHSTARVWYVLTNKEIYKVLKAARTTQDVEGLEAHEFDMSNNTWFLPTLARSGGSAEVSYRTNYGARDRSFFYVRKSSSGKYRIFEGDNGSNGLCEFLNR